jgi:hypothetical protein
MRLPHPVDGALLELRAPVPAAFGFQNEAIR